MSKFGVLLGAGIGYVLGARDGRERYEQIQQQAQRIWKDPRVQEKKQQAANMATWKGGELQDKAARMSGDESSKETSATSSSDATEGTAGSPTRSFTTSQSDRMSAGDARGAGDGTVGDVWGKSASDTTTRAPGTSKSGGADD